MGNPGQSTLHIFALPLPDAPSPLELVAGWGFEPLPFQFHFEIKDVPLP